MGNINNIVSKISNKFPHVDYEGQRLAEKIYQRVLILFAVVGLLWGFICQEFSQTIYILGAGCLLAALLVLPPWPFYRQHPLNWQKPYNPVASKAASGSSTSGKSGKRKARAS